MKKKRKRSPASEQEKDKTLPAAVRKALKAHRQAADDMPLNATLGVGAQIPQEVQAKMTQEDCIKLLQGICFSRPNYIVSRDYFRKHSGIGDRVWTQYFGKFNQFKQAANIKVSRRAEKLRLHVSKHSAADDLRATNKDRRSYCRRYLKPKDGRWKTILLCSDVHDIECDPFALRVYMDVAKRLGSTYGCDVITDIINGGDLYDLPEFSKHHVDPRKWDPVKRMNWVENNYWAPLDDYCPRVEKTLIEGNHEMRVNALLTAQTPAVKVVLADFHGMTIPKFLGLDRWEVNYIANGDLAAVDYSKAAMKKELLRNWKVFYDCFLVHHFLVGQKKGLPGVHGHHHKHLVWTHDSPQYGAYEWHQLGAMHIRYATYADGEKWNNGFSLVHIDTKTKAVEFEYIVVGSTQCVAAGQFYERTKKEFLL